MAKATDLMSAERSELEALGWTTAACLESADLEPITDTAAHTTARPLVKLRRSRYQRARVERGAVAARRSRLGPRRWWGLAAPTGASLWAPPKGRPSWGETEGGDLRANSPSTSSPHHGVQEQASRALN
jgi:hypothetical protein